MCLLEIVKIYKDLFGKWFIYDVIGKSIYLGSAQTVSDGIPISVCADYSAGTWANDFFSKAPPAEYQ